MICMISFDGVDLNRSPSNCCAKRNRVERKKKKKKRRTCASISPSAKSLHSTLATSI